MLVVETDNNLNTLLVFFVITCSAVVQFLRMVLVGPGSGVRVLGNAKIISNMSLQKPIMKKTL